MWHSIQIHQPVSTLSDTFLCRCFERWYGLSFTAHQRPRKAESGGYWLSNIQQCQEDLHHLHAAQAQGYLSRHWKETHGQSVPQYEAARWQRTQDGLWTSILPHYPYRRVCCLVCRCHQPLWRGGDQHSSTGYHCLSSWATGVRKRCVQFRECLLVISTVLFEGWLRLTRSILQHCSISKADWSCKSTKGQRRNCNHPGCHGVYTRNIASQKPPILTHMPLLCHMFESCTYDCKSLPYF